MSQCGLCVSQKQWMTNTWQSDTQSPLGNKPDEGEIIWFIIWLERFVHQKKYKKYSYLGIIPENGSSLR